MTSNQGGVAKGLAHLKGVEISEIFSPSLRLISDFSPTRFNARFPSLYPVQKTSLHQVQGLSGNLGDLCKISTLQELIFEVFDCLGHVA